jgi:hypothetical protein
VAESGSLGSKDARALACPGSIMGWHLIEGDLVAVGHHIAEWADVLECEVYPAVEDAGAADAVKGVFGRT